MSIPTWWHSWLNHLGFAWRQHYSPMVAMAKTRPYTEPFPLAASVARLWEERGASQTEGVAVERYLTHLEERLLKKTPLLENLKQRASVLRYTEALTIAHQLDAILEEVSCQLPANTANKPAWLDIGAKNWAYVDALANQAYQLFGQQPFNLVGVELDGNRLYATGHTRGQAAQYASQQLEEALTTLLAAPGESSPELGCAVTYQHQNVLTHAGQYQVISWLLPFVVADPCLLWGLPLTHFAPLALWQHVTQHLLMDGGLLLLINQGHDEAEAQRALIQQSPEMTVLSEGWLPEVTFLDYDIPRHGWVCQKQPVS